MPILPLGAIGDSIATTAGTASSPGSPTSPASRSSRFGDGRTPNSETQRGRTPKSYRGLVDGIATSEEAATVHKREALETSFEIAELRNGYRNAMSHVEMLQREEAHFYAEMQNLNLESAAVWSAHEQPLQDQEEAVQTSARLVAALELRQESRTAVNSSLRLECEELEQLSVTLRSETTESEESHVAFTHHMDRAEASARTLAARCNEWDQRVEVLQSKVKAERDRDELIEAEIDAARIQMDATNAELSDMERHCQGSVMTWWQDQGSRCHSLAVESEMLQQELEMGRLQLEHHTEESAVWREQAYRSEAGLLQLRRGDVASGIRSLCEQCTAYANANAASPP